MAILGHLAIPPEAHSRRGWPAIPLHAASPRYTLMDAKKQQPCRCG